MQTVAIIDYGLANIRSVVNAVECFEAKVKVAAAPAELADADKIILPGVGSFDAGMRGLKSRGLDRALKEAVHDRGRPFFGICLGMQFLFEGSDEGAEAGLGWIGGGVKGFPKTPGAPKVPHIGWSEVALTGRGRLTQGMGASIDVYFVHSYYIPNEGEAAACASGLCAHGLTFVAALERENVFACQFHPEKSQLSGMKMFEQFLSL
ncbi:MAG: imidazole glycerol phosphate synthase subunit HisH [Rhodospirillaceae bacterium]